MLGGAIGGILSAIPLLNILNCCFCALNIAGAMIGIANYLKSHPGENISNGDAALSGAMSGALAGAIAGAGGLVLNLLIGGMIASMYRTLPPQLLQILAQSSARGVIAIPIDIVMFGAFGALGGFLTMQLFYKERLRVS